MLLSQLGVIVNVSLLIYRVEDFQKLTLNGGSRTLGAGPGRFGSANQDMTTVVNQVS